VLQCVVIVLQCVVIVLQCVAVIAMVVWNTKCQRLAFASRSHARALAACLPHQNHVYITTDELFRFHKMKFDETPYNLVSIESAHSFKKYATPS